MSTAAAPGAEPFDAVLAEMRANSRFENGRWVHVAATGPELERWADRLAAAHAAEVGERDARIAELDSECRQHLLRALENGQAALAAESRAEAAERDARRAVGLLREVRGYLSAAEESSMSRNNSEQLAYEFGERIDAATKESAHED